MEAHTLYWTELSLNIDSTTRVRDQRTENTTRPESETREQRTRHDQSQNKTRPESESREHDSTTRPESERREHDTTKIREQRTLHNQSQRQENTTRQKKELVSVKRAGQALDDLPSKDEKSRRTLEQFRRLRGWETSKGRCLSAYGIFQARRYRLELN